jgi:hypothetical protein
MVSARLAVISQVYQRFTDRGPESVRNFVRRGGRQERFRRPQGVA